VNRAYAAVLSAKAIDFALLLIRKMSTLIRRSLPLPLTGCSDPVQQSGDFGPAFPRRLLSSVSSSTSDASTKEPGGEPNA
jgi:hypothetical protein